MLMNSSKELIGKTSLVKSSTLTSFTIKTGLISILLLKKCTTTSCLSFQAVQVVVIIFFILEYNKIYEAKLSDHKEKDLFFR
jgi:hypothetical protein